MRCRSRTPGANRDHQVRRGGDPARGNQVSGHNRVLDIENEDVTGQVKLFTCRNNEQRELHQPDSERTVGGDVLDVTYEDISQVPKAIAHRITVTTPPTPVGTEHMAVGHSIPIGREAIVISPPLKGSGWVNGNGCCLEIGPHRFVTNSMNGTLDPSETFAIDWVQVDAHGLAYGPTARSRRIGSVTVLKLRPSRRAQWLKWCAICRT